MLRLGLVVMLDQLEEGHQNLLMKALLRLVVVVVAAAVVVYDY